MSGAIDGRVKRRWCGRGCPSGVDGLNVQPSAAKLRAASSRHPAHLGDTPRVAPVRSTPPAAANPGVAKRPRSIGRGVDRERVSRVRPARAQQQRSVQHRARHRPRVRAPLQRSAVQPVRHQPVGRLQRRTHRTSAAERLEPAPYEPCDRRAQAAATAPRPAAGRARGGSRSHGVAGRGQEQVVAHVLWPKPMWSCEQDGARRPEDGRRRGPSTPDVVLVKIERKS